MQYVTSWEMDLYGRFTSTALNIRFGLELLGKQGKGTNQRRVKFARNYTTL